HKPPGPLDWYEGLEDIQLYNALGQLMPGYFLGATRHRPAPPVEVDTFPRSQAEIVLVLPDGTEELVRLSGLSTVVAYFDGSDVGSAADDDNDGFDEVVVEMVEMRLTGSSSLGPVTLSLATGHGPLRGLITETSNATPGTLDLAPFAEGGMALSFFEGFFRLDVGASTFFSDPKQPLQMQGSISHTPAWPGEAYVNVEPISLFNAFGGDTGLSIRTLRYVSNPGPVVMGRHVFYNDSFFDGNDPLPNEGDDKAIAPDKKALLPGETASFSNYTSYSKGINGVMFDIAGRTESLPLNAAEDLLLQVGNSSDPTAWSPAPEPLSVTTRPGAGVNGSDRVVIIWKDNAIERQWLQVTVLPTRNTELSSPDVFSFGNAPGEAGDNPINTIVNATDEIVARNFQHSAVDQALIDDPYDYNRDGLVDGTDQLIARNNQTNPLTMLRLISAPAVDALVDQTTGQDAQDPQASLADLNWLYEFEQMNAKNQAAKKKGSIESAVDMLLATDWK
ncbi:MAG: hypothetical protein V3R99_13470, partial [Thermoguttaceae bacterium]